MAGNLERDAPGDLVLEVLEDLVLESRLGPRLRLPVGFPVARDLESGRVEQVEDGLAWAFSLLVLRLGVDVPAGVELGRDLQRHRVARPGLRRLDRRGQDHILGLGPRGAVFLCRLRGFVGPQRAGSTITDRPDQKQKRRETDSGEIAVMIAKHGEDPVRLGPRPSGR